MDRTDRRARATYVLAAVALVAWGLHWLWGPELPPGVDATGHLTRLDVGLGLLADGRLDGWFDRTMLGYQTHLLYGPGLALAVGIVRVASLGLLSTPGAYQAVGALSLLAIVPAAAALTRAFGAPVGAARAAGLLALAVSSGRGGGIQGTFDLGLMPNSVAAPLVLVAWALLLTERDRPILLGLVVGSVAITHPQSLIVFVLFAPLVLAAGWACGVVDPARWRRLMAGAAVALGASAWWWIPAVVHRDLRGVLTSWDLPTLTEHLGLIVRGERGWIGWAATLVIATWVVGVVVTAWVGPRRRLALAVLPLGALGLLHVVERTLVDSFYEVVLLPNRGFAYACYLAVPFVGIVLHRLLAAPRHAAWLLAGLVVAVSVPAMRPPSSALDTPDPAMRRVANVLADVVPPGQRVAYLYGRIDRSGVPAPGRWLGWTSGVTDLGPFGAEYAPGVGPTLMVFEPPHADTVDAWVHRASSLGVSHLVTSDPDLHEVLTTAAWLELAVSDPPLSIWRVLLDPPVQPVEVSAEHLVVDVVVRQSFPTILPVGFSPGWSATTDRGTVELDRSADGRLVVQLPAGTHRVDLRWSEPAGHGLGRLVTLVTVVALTGTRLRHRRHLRSMGR